MPHSAFSNTISRALRALCLLCIGGLLSGTLHAAVLLGVTADPPLGGISGPAVMVTRWTQTNTWTHVTITVPLRDYRPGGPHAGTQGTVYLVSQVGPGTTAAHNVLPPRTVSGLGDTFAHTELWEDATLPPGTYHLLFVPASADPSSMTPAIAGDLAETFFTTGPGITLAQGALFPGGPVDAFPPATAFDTRPGFAPFLVRIEGTPGPLPAPTATPVPTLGHGALALLSASVAGLAAWRRRRGVRG